MDRLALPGSELHLYVTPLTAHRLFAASLIIAIKFVAEKPPSVFNDRYTLRLCISIIVAHRGFDVLSVTFVMYCQLMAPSREA